jgi:hypothetical protein
MKKFIALLLVAMMCFALVACGDGSGDTSECIQCEKYEDLIELLENKKYKEAIIEIYELAGAPSNDNNNVNNSETEPPTQEIEITLNNWQEYFEITLIPKVVKNDFDEPIGFYTSTVFMLKNEWHDLIKDWNINIEYSLTEGYYAYFNYDMETQELTESDRIQNHPDPRDIIKETDSIRKNLAAPIKQGWVLAGKSYLPSTFSISESVVRAQCEVYSNIEVHRIQGTITVQQ